MPSNPRFIRVRVRSQLSYLRISCEDVSLPEFSYLSNLGEANATETGFMSDDQEIESAWLAKYTPRSIAIEPGRLELIRDNSRSGEIFVSHDGQQCALIHCETENPLQLFLIGSPDFAKQVLADLDCAQPTRQVFGDM